MFFKTGKILIETTKPIQLIDITDKVRDFCQSYSIQNGMIVVKSHHTTAAVSINEKCEKLEEDFLNFAKSIADPKADYLHNQSPIDGRLNAHSHLIKFFMPSSETLILEKGHLNLGEWQKIFFVELDGPRQKREVHVTVIGE